MSDDRLKRAISRPDPSFDPAKKLGLPGQYPFTRGIYPTMYAGRLWTMRQYAGFGTAHETNQRYRYLLQHGQTGLSVAFDLPTQMGYDPDHPRSRGEVGKSGVSIASIEDMEVLFDGIPLPQVTTSMTINATAHILLAMYIALGRRRGDKASELGGTVQNDILKEFAARGCYIYPPEPSLKIATDVIEFCVRHLPRWNFISVSGYHIREAGSTAAQELGFTLANGICYVQSALSRGLDVNAVGQRISFFFNVHNNFLEEIAKFRAARRLWARIMKERFRATDDRALMLRFHAQTAGSTLTSQQPLNNVVRVSLQCLAAILGGAQSIHTNSYDEALGLPTEKSAKIALRTQQILAHEAGLTDVADPFGGSWHLERETDRLEAEAEQYIRKIDQMGGAVEAVRTGYYRREIERSAYETLRKIESGEQIVVGVNRYVDEQPRPIQILKVNEKLHEERAAALRSLRARRSSDSANRALDALRRARDRNENLMPAVIECVENLVTLGEISAALEESWGRYQPEEFKP